MARKTLKTPAGIVRYANVFTPRANKGKDGKPRGEPKYSLLLVFDKRADLSELEEAVEAAAVERFGPKAKTMLANGRLRNPIRDASDYVDEELSDEENYPFNLPGARMVRFATQDQPGVVDADAEPLMSKTDFYDGCRARVSYRPFAYDNESKGVSVALINVQKLDDGERLSGNPSAEDDFKSEKTSSAARGKRKPKAEDDDDDMLG